MYKVEDSNITGQGGSKMYNIEAKCVELSRKFRDISLRGKQSFLPPQ